MIDDIKIVAKVFHNIYGIRYLLALSSIFLVSVYKYIEDIRIIIVSTRDNALFFNVKKNKVNS